MSVKKKGKFSKEEKLNILKEAGTQSVRENVDKYDIYPPEEDVNVRALKYFFKAYVVDQDILEILKLKDFQALQTNATLTIAQFKAVITKYREVIPMYIKDYITLEQFAA